MPAEHFPMHTTVDRIVDYVLHEEDKRWTFWEKLTYHGIRHWRLTLGSTMKTTSSHFVSDHRSKNSMNSNDAEEIGTEALALGNFQ